jgi:hypothetical protein
VSAPSCPLKPIPLRSKDIGIANDVAVMEQHKKSDAKNNNNFFINLPHCLC